MSDALLTLAQAPGGLTCFLVPRWTPDGERNPSQLMRLKDKLGNRANASAEIEYVGAWARHARRRGRRGADDHRDGAPHPARHRDGAGRADAGGALRGALVVREPRGLRAAADRAAADGIGARRPRARGRGGDGARASGGAGVRRRRPGVRAGRRGAGEVPQQQALPADDLRGDGMPRRRRLCRGGADAASLPRGPAELDLGRERQRDLPRRAPHASPATPRPAPGSTPSSTPAAAATPATTPGSTRWRGAGRTRCPRPRRAGSSSGWRRCSRPPCCCAPGAEPVAEAYVASRVAGEGGRVAGALPARLDRRALIGRAMPC